MRAGEPDDRREISVPIAYPELWGSDVDWDFRTVPQPALDDRSLDVTQGKTLGGSSSINAQLYFRGHPADYDGWAAAGNDCREYDAVHERFERIENGPGEPYGTGGSQHVAEQGDPHPLTEAFVDAAVETGIQRDGKRHSAADAFLKPVLDRSTLTAETGARVRRVTFDGDRATGVVYERNGETGRVTADGVILSAGAINSPRLLMLSGIGPADHLYQQGIDVRVDLPGVGHNLQDHPIVYTSYETSHDTYGGADTLVNLLKYLVFKRGPLTSNGSEAAAFWRSSTTACGSTASRTSESSTPRSCRRSPGRTPTRRPWWSPNAPPSSSRTRPDWRRRSPRHAHRNSAAQSAVSTPLRMRHSSSRSSNSRFFSRASGSSHRFSASSGSAFRSNSWPSS